MTTFTDLYKELAEKITIGVEAIQWVDLWNSQVYHLEDEHPFPAPAVFLAFRSNQMTDAGSKLQEVTMQVDAFLFYETFADTYKGSWNQSQALDYINILDNLNKVLHGSQGDHYNEMRRISFSPMDTGGAGNLYNITYTCKIVDNSAKIEWDEGSFNDVVTEPLDNQYILTEG